MAPGLAVRRNIDDLSPEELDRLRQALVEAASDSVYASMLRIHSADLPMYSQRASSLFLPWNRAFLVRFEALLRAHGADAIPYWDWSSPRSRETGLPSAVTDPGTLGANPLAYARLPELNFESNAAPTKGARPPAPPLTGRSPAAPQELPDADAVADLLASVDYLSFATTLQEMCNRVRVWVGGTSASVSTAVYDPVFWIITANADRLWAQWQTEHVDTAVSTELMEPLEQSPADVQSIASLGYTYDLLQDGGSGASAAATRDRIDVQLRMLADAPIDDERLDFLGHRDYAEALSFVIDHPDTGTPLTIALHAPWGAGKTSLALMTERRLQRVWLRLQPPITCWFNAWQHDDAPNIATALAATVARAVAPERSIWRRLFDPLPTGLLTPEGRRRRHLLRTMSSVTIAVIVLAVSGQYTQLTSKGLTLAVVAGLLAAAVQTVTSVLGTASAVSGLIRSPNTTLTSGSLREVSEDLGKLIHQSTQRGIRRHPDRPHRRLIVFIDDIERCQSPRSIDVCEKVNHLLSHQDVVVVLIGDMQTIATAAESKYKDLTPRHLSDIPSGDNGDGPAASFGEKYLEKVVQFRFDVPVHGKGTIRELARKILEGSSVPPPVVAYSRLDVLRQAIRRRLGLPGAGWRQRRRLNRAVDDLRTLPVSADTGPPADQVEAIVARVVDDPELVMEGRALLGEIEADHLAQAYEAIYEHVRPLPRDVKRILNRMRFMLYLTLRRDLLAPDGPLAVQSVGKWALLAERWPDLAVAIADEPASMAKVEAGCAKSDDFREVMKGIVPGYAHSTDLWRLVAAKPGLEKDAEVLSRLSASRSSPT